MVESVGKSMFAAGPQREIVERLHRLAATNARQWGKMEVGQMLTHCALALELPMNDPSRRQHLIGKILAPFVRRKWLDDSPFSHDSPTDPDFVVREARDFAAERARLLAAIDRFVERGPALAAETIHSFFGRLTGDEWGRLVYKHLDHHLRQFGG